MGILKGGENMKKTSEEVIFTVLLIGLIMALRPKLISPKLIMALIGE